MTKYGLRAQVITYTILPTIFIGGLLAVYFSYHRHQEANDALISNAINISEPLAIASEYGMTDETRTILSRIISATHRKNSEMIKSIAIFDANNKLFVTSNYHQDFKKLQLDKKHPIPETTQIKKFEDSIIVYSPIINETNFLEYKLTFDTPRTVIGYVSIEINHNPVELLLYRDASVSIFIVLFGVLASLLFALKQAQRITAPVSQMAKVVDKISLGRLNSRVDGEYSGELQLLKEGINVMAIAMSKHHEEMQDSIDLATSELRETLDQMEIQNIELDITRKDAQKATSVKSEFLANMSHELRTPLNGVIGFARQLLKTKMTPNQVDYLQTIERSASNLLTIINDILDFSKLEAGKLKLENIPFDLRDSIDETMHLLAPSAHEKKLELSMMFDPSVPLNVIGDSMRIQQIMTNLIANAIKFTEQGNIEVKVQRIEQTSNPDNIITLQIMVLDSGIGISETQQLQLFKAFGQADSSITRQYGGTGLGLVITQKLIKEMNGKIELTSTVDKGSIFSFTINIEANTHNQLKHLATDSLQQKSVLVYDENSFSASACIQLLELWEVELNLAKTRTQFEGFLKEQYDSIIIGYSDCSDLEKLHDHINIAKAFSDNIIVLLNSSNPIYYDEIRDWGVAHCLSKPINHKNMADALLSNRQVLPLISQKIEAPIQQRDICVLAVDDNLANLKLISAMLSDQVKHITSCTNGQQAVDSAKNKKYDLIFMDIQMPVLDGVNAAKQIKNIPINKDTPIIAVTAHILPGEKEAFLQKGMDDCLAKPIDEKALRNILNVWVSNPSDNTNTQPELLTSPLTNVSFDWKMALKQSAEKEDLAIEMLSMLLAEFSEVRTAIKESLKGTMPTEQLKTLIHRFHGGCSYSGVPKLKKITYLLEQELKQGISVDLLEPELLEMLDELDNVEHAAKKYLPSDS